MGDERLAYLRCGFLVSAPARAACKTVDTTESRDVMFPATQAYALARPFFAGEPPTGLGHDRTACENDLRVTFSPTMAAVSLARCDLLKRDTFCCGPNMCGVGNPASFTICSRVPVPSLPPLLKIVFLIIAEPQPCSPRLGDCKAFVSRP